MARQISDEIAVIYLGRVVPVADPESASRYVDREIAHADDAVSVAAAAATKQAGTFAGESRPGVADTDDDESRPGVP